MEEKKKNPEEEIKDGEQPETADKKQGDSAPDDPPKDAKPDERSEEKTENNNPTDDEQDDENGTGADQPKSSDDGNPAEKKQEEAVPEVPQLSETDQLKAENLTLKTQLEAMKIGFSPECMEDAVILAEAIVKRDGTDISAALQSVAKKYPDWKQGGKDSKDGKSSGFKVGADSGKGQKSDDEKLNNAFGIKKKKC